MGNVVVNLDRWYEIDQDQILQTGRITMSSSYANSGTASNSGDTITAADIKKLMPHPNDLTRADKFLLVSGNSSTDGYSARVDRTHAKVRVLNGTTEVTNATSLSALVFDFILIYENVQWLAERT